MARSLGWDKVGTVSQDAPQGHSLPRGSCRAESEALNTAPGGVAGHRLGSVVDYGS